MELLTKSREELLEIGGKLKLEFPKNIPEDRLRSMIETEIIEKSTELEEKARLRLQEQSRMKRDIAEIQAEAAIRGIKIDIPQEPKLTDIIKLKKELDLMIKEPKPSPETLAIEASKKVYAVFHNREQDDMDIPDFTVGGKYWFHLWPEKVHILPEWVINHWRKTARYPLYGKITVPNPQGVKVGETIEKVGRTGWRQRFLFEILGDAPDDSSFGVVLDEEILSKLTQPV
jgi:hypothetical protein